MDYAIQRKNMVETQVRPSDVTDRRIVRAMLALPREAFVPERVRALSYMDGDVPLSGPGDAAGRALLSARVLAKLVQALAVDAGSTVLDIGAASGYGAAVLSHLAGRVVALEEDAALAASARTALAAAGAGAVTVVQGPLAAGCAGEGPYDAILIEGAVDAVPPAVLDQLKDGGRLVAIVGDHRTGRATLWRRDGRTYGAMDLFDAAANGLPGFRKAPAFAF